MLRRAIFCLLSLLWTASALAQAKATPKVVEAQPAPESKPKKPKNLPWPAKVTKYQDLTLVFDAGKVRLEKTVIGQFAKPTPLKRYLGRFAVLVQTQQGMLKVRFDFPLLAAPTMWANEDIRAADWVARGAHSQTVVRVPADLAIEGLAVADLYRKRTWMLLIKAPTSPSVPAAATPSPEPASTSEK